MTGFKSTDGYFWGCSECTWTFDPSGPPRGDSLDEMQENFEGQRDKEFASHVCIEYQAASAKNQEAKDKSGFPRGSDDEHKA